jgi:predicted nuclease of predicted toxin-antitoxin system
LKILADECIERSIIRHLRDNGITVDAVAELTPGASDTSIIGLANRKGDLLLTADKDFGELIFRQGKLSNGVILVRLHGLSSKTKGETVVQALVKHQDKLVGSFTVIEPTQIRISRFER